MTTTDEEFVASAFEQLARSIPPPVSVPADAIGRRLHARRRNRMRVRWAGATAAMVVVAAGTWLIARDDPRERVAAVASDSATRAADVARSQAWTTLPPGPLRGRSEAATAFSGDHLFIWGGENEATGEVFGDGALYSLATGEWRRLPGSPLPAAAGALAVWHVDRFYVVGPSAGAIGTGSSTGGAAYDPSSNAWHALPPSPLSLPVPVAATSTSDGVVLITGSPARSLDEPPVDVALYRPTTGTWSPLAPPAEGVTYGDLAWTGQEAVLVGGALGPNNASLDPDGARASALDASTGTWRSLPQPGLSTQAIAATWTGAAVVAVDYGGDAAVLPADETAWTPVESGLPPTECWPRLAAPGDGRAVASMCGAFAMWDGATWSPLPALRTDDGGSIDGTLVATPSLALTWGSGHGSTDAVLAVLRLPSPTD